MTTELKNLLAISEDPALPQEEESFSHLCASW
jgi:hypothetical protein